MCGGGSGPEPPAPPAGPQPAPSHPTAPARPPPPAACWAGVPCPSPLSLAPRHLRRDKSPVSKPLLSPHLWSYYSVDSLSGVFWPWVTHSQVVTPTPSEPLRETERTPPACPAWDACCHLRCPRLRSPNPAGGESLPGPSVPCPPCPVLAFGGPGIDRAPLILPSVPGLADGGSPVS